jgi:hypothetical protein
VTGWIPDVVPDQVIASAWGNQIRDRTVTPFANAAARNAAIVAPVVGMATFLDDTNALEVYDGALWRPVVGIGSRIGYAAVTAADVTQGASATVATISITPATNRLVKIEAMSTYSMVSGSSNGNTYARIGVDGTFGATHHAANHSLGTGGIAGGSAWQYSTLTAAAHTVIISATNAATTACAMRFSAGSGALAIYDYGPV